MSNMSEKIPFSTIKSKPSQFNLFRLDQNHGLGITYDSIRDSVNHAISDSASTIQTKNTSTALNPIESGLSQMAAINPITLGAIESNKKDVLATIKNGISIPDLLTSKNKQATSISLSAMTTAASHSLTSTKRNKNKKSSDSDGTEDNYTDVTQLTEFVEDRIDQVHQKRSNKSLNSFVNLNNDKKTYSNAYQTHQDYADKVVSFFKTLRVLLGPSQQLDSSLLPQTTQSDPMNSSNSELVLDQDKPTGPTQTTQDELAHFHQWWDTTGQSLPLDVLASFYTLLKNAPSSLDNITSHQNDTTILNSVQLYVTKMKKTLLGQYRGNSDISVDSLPKNQVQQLKENGFLSLTNYLTKKFDFDNIHQNLALKNTPEENFELHQKLRDLSHAKDSLEAIDQTHKQAITMVSPNGQKYTLDSLLNDTLQTSDSVEETLSNLTEVYTVLLDQVSTMSGLSDTRLSTPKQPLITPTQDGHYEMTIYPKGEWDELTLNNGRYAYVKKTNLPLKLTFNSQDAATKYFNHIVTITQSLSDCLTPHFSRIPTKTHYSNDKAVTSGLRLLNVDDTHLSIEYPFNAACFSSPSFSSVLNQFGKKVQLKTTKQIMSNIMFTNITNNQHKSKSNKYQQEKEAHDANEEARIKEEHKRQKNRLAYQQNYKLQFFAIAS